MKRIYIILAVACMTLAMASCSDSKNKKFNPTERKSSMTDAQRDDAINELKMSLSAKIDSLLFTHGVKLSVLPPAPDGNDITESLAERIATKLVQITAANGIGGLNNSPTFALGARLDQTARTATGSAPQKMMVKYDVTYEVINVPTGDVYATATDEIVGVGASFEEANVNAVQEMKDSPKLQKMLQTGSERIIDWYNNNLQTLKSQVEAAAGKKDYVYALALVESVPEQAKAAFQYASQQQPKLLEAMNRQQAAETLSAMQAAIAKANDTFDPAVAACLQMVPADSPEYKEAKSAYDAYVKKVETKQAEIAKKAAEDEAYARKQAEIERQMQHEKELVEIEAEKMKSKYEARASVAAMEKSMRDNQKGFWGKLGDRIIGAIDNATDDAEWND